MTASTASVRRARLTWFWAMTPAQASALVGVVMLIVYLLSATYGSQQSHDNIATELPAWKLTHHGTLALPEYVGQNRWVHPTHGTAYSDRFPGVVLWTIPFYALFGRADFSFVAGGVAGATSAALAVALAFFLAEQMTSRRTALALAAVVGFATSVWTVAADTIWTHGPASVWMLLALVLASRDRWRTASAAFAMTILVRPHLALVAASVGLFCLLKRRQWRPVLWCGVGVAAGGLIVVAYQHLLWGTWGLLPPVFDTRLQNGLVSPVGFLRDVAGTLVSPERGVLVLSPFLLALIPGLPAAWRVAPDWVRGAAVGGTAYMLVQLWGNPFDGGFYFFSYRLPIDWLIPCIPLLLLAWTTWTSRTARRRAVFLLLVGVSVFSQAMGAFGHTKWTWMAGPWKSYPVAAFAVLTPWRLPLAVAIAAGVIGAFLAAGYRPTTNSD